MKPKNVVIIMADQLRYDALGEHTPSMNQLLDESVQFNRAYCASPLCAPARGAFFTGKYPNVNGSLINPWLKDEAEYGFVKEEHTHLYELMEEQWDSWHTGKQHLFMDPKPNKRESSKTNWLPLEGRYDAFLKVNNKDKPGGPEYKGIVPEMAYGKVTRTKSYSVPHTGHYEEGLDYFFDGFILKDSLQAIRDRDRNKPFLLNAMFVAPHPPLQVPEPWYSRVKQPVVPENVGKWYEGQSPLQLYNLTGFIGQQYERKEWERIWEVYLGLVSLLDHCVGQIVAELKKEDMYDDTLLVFTSDHGEMLGSHRLWQKMCMYEESVKTPLAMKFPKSFQPAVREVDEIVSSVDVLPTLCEYVGIDAPAGLSGRSLMPLVKGEETKVMEADGSARSEIFIQYDGNGARGNFQRCILSGNFKLIVDIFKDELYLELYDVVHDPQETNNLVFHEDVYRTRTIEMIDALRSHMKKTKDLLEIPAGIYDTFLEQYAPFYMK